MAVSKNEQYYNLEGRLAYINGGTVLDCTSKEGWAIAAFSKGFTDEDIYNRQNNPALQQYMSHQLNLRVSNQITPQVYDDKINTFVKNNSCYSPTLTALLRDKKISELFN